MYMCMHTCTVCYQVCWTYIGIKYCPFPFCLGWNVQDFRKTVQVSLFYDLHAFFLSLFPSPRPPLSPRPSANVLLPSPLQPSLQLSTRHQHRGTVGKGMLNLELLGSHCMPTKETSGGLQEHAYALSSQHIMSTHWQCSMKRSVHVHSILHSLPCRRS